MSQSLFPLFVSSLGIKDETSIVHGAFDRTLTKMANLRKEDWKASRQIIAVHKAGKTCATTLMLRDELKPIVISKREKQ